jgi:hypothetical protein
VYIDIGVVLEMIHMEHFTIHVFGFLLSLQEATMLKQMGTTFTDSNT